MTQINCKHFTGYKPCGLNEQCSENCPSRSLVSNRIIVVHLEALGAVLRATCLLPLIRKKFPNAHITWITKSPAQQLLENNPLVDRVMTIDHESILKLSALNFDVAFCIDKSLLASGVLNSTTYDYLYGFKVDASSGAILPATNAAKELWDIGLSNKKKFFENKKTENQLMVEALELGEYAREESHLFLSEYEAEQAKLRRKQWLGSNEYILGINTGCAPTIAYKKLSIAAHREIIRKLKVEIPILKVVLLGGQQDSERNRLIAEGLPGVTQSPTDQGIRDGIISMQACDLVLSGDSFGMHMGIGLKKWVIAWFGPTCSHEIDLYERGYKVLSKAECGPCWKRFCQKEVMCYDQVSSDEIIQAVKKGIQWSQTSSSSKPHLLETHF